jgi:pimeloyl-ACP methyl ester carboxylesterase
MLATALETLPDGKRVRVARLGAGPPLLLLHGYPDNLQIWAALAPLLATSAQVIAFDWPGLGESDPWPGAVTPEHMAARVVALLDHWGLPRASLLAHDMGGQPALACAARHPERVERLVVMNSLVLPDEDTSWEIKVLRRYGWNRFVLRRLARAVFWRAERTSLPPGQRLPAGLRGELWRSFRRKEVRACVARLCAAYQGTLDQLPALYEQIECPTLVLWGRRDRHFPPAHAQRLQEAILHAHVEVLPEGEHWMAWHAADAVAERVASFLGPPGPVLRG